MRLRVRKTALNQLIKRRFAFVGVWPVNNWRINLLRKPGNTGNCFTEIIKYLIDGFFQVLRPVRKTILRGIVFLFWGGISIRSGLLNDSDQVKIRWNFTEILGVGDLKNAGNKEKWRKNDRLFYAGATSANEKNTLRNHYPKRLGLGVFKKL